MPAPRRPFSLVRWTLIYVPLIFFGLITAVPFLWMVTTAFKGQGDAFTSLFLPRGSGFLGIAWDRLTLENFRALFREFPMGGALLNSIFFASVCSFFATLFSAMGGYGLSKFRFRGRGWLTVLVLGTCVLPMPLLIAPRFELIYHLHLLDTYSGFLLPELAPAFGLFLFRQSMLNHVPAEILESARLDGCGEIRIFFTLVLPLVRPMIGAFVIITFLGVWTNFLGPQVILQTPERQPLAVVIAGLRDPTYVTNYGLMMAGALVSIAPIICLFLLLQKEFIAGLTTGTVKG